MNDKMYFGAINLILGLTIGAIAVLLSLSLSGSDYASGYLDGQKDYFQGKINIEWEETCVLRRGLKK